MAIVAGTTATGLMVLVMMLLLLMVMMVGTFTSTVAVSLRMTLHIVVAGSGGDVGGVEGSSGTASGSISARCHNVQLPDCSRRLLIVYRANAADDRGRDLRFSITFCGYDCTMLLLLLLLLPVTLVITTTRSSLVGPGDQILLLLLLLVLVVLPFRGILLAGLRALQTVASCHRRCACRRRSRRTAAAARLGY